MKEISRPPFPNPLILDTGPLLEFVICEFAARYHHGWALKELITYALLDEESKRRYLRHYFEKTPRILTTPSVLTEVARHVEQPKKVCYTEDHRSQMWRIILDFFKRKKVEEETLRLLEMPPDRIHIDGPADWSVILLAEKVKGTVLTVEERRRGDGMLVQCGNRGVPCKSLHELLGH